MKVSVSFVFALAISLSCIAITTPSFAKMLKCERYDTRNENTYALGAFDSWFPKSLSLNPKVFSKIPERKSLIFKQEMRYLFDNGKPTRVHTLFTNGQLNMSVTSQQGGARYKCNMKPEEVLAAQIKKSASQKCRDGEDILTSCTNKQLCRNATSGKWVNGQQKKVWETSERFKKYVKGAKARGLDCDVSETSNQESKPSRIDFSSWNNIAVCTVASEQGRWSVKTKFEQHVQEAKRRGLSCGVSEASSQSTTQSSTSSTTSTPSKADTSKAFCKDIGFTAGTEKFGECVLKMMDK